MESFLLNIAFIQDRAMHFQLERRRGAKFAAGT